MDRWTLTLVLEGAYEFSDITIALRAAFSDAKSGAGLTLMIDDRRSTVNRSAEETRAQAAWIASRRPNIARVALLASADPSCYGMARMASVLFEMEGLDAQVFTEPDDAKHWLDSGSRLARTDVAGGTGRPL
jgi:hypothetical protein